jgi:pimeloyl-ACP methyl ester carboxylesterase
MATTSPAHATASTPTYRFDASHPVRKTTFLSKGIRCAATLHLPAGGGAGARWPAILMVHGWSGIQASMLPPFCDRFVREGYAVMTFDYRGWGDSEGCPRHVIRVEDRHEDVESALAHLRGFSEVNADRIVLWGTSLGGGHACVLGARHPELLAVMAQVPMLDGRAASAATPLSWRLRLGILGGLDLLRADLPLYLKTVGQPGEFSTMNRDGAAEARERSMALYGHQSTNRVAARSILSLATYRPYRALPDLQVPTLLVKATRDTVAPFTGEISNPRITVRVLDANHFEPYFEPVFSMNIGYQLEFLRACCGEARSAG